MAGSGASVDISDLTRLVADLGRAGRQAVKPARELLTKVADEVRDDLRQQARGHATFPHFPRSITVDVRGLDAEIGPDKQRRQGALGNVLYFGTSRTAPVLEHPGQALDRAVPGIAARLAQVGEDAIGSGQ